MPERPLTDLEKLMEKRIQKRFDAFTKDIIEEHEQTRNTVKEAISVMNRTSVNKTHIVVLYILNIALLICYLLLII